MSQGVDEATDRRGAPILLVTKLQPPPVPAQAVARERLFERLRDGRGARLSLVACPAGFGKSTLLAAWLEADARGRPTAWVTLDEGDNDAVVLWSHVIEALRRACPDLADETLTTLAVTAPVLEVLLPTLVNALAGQGEVVLVLDDFHRVSSPSTRESMAWFVEHLPATVQLVLSSRTDPALPLGALRAHGQLVELRVDEMRFTPAEANEFLNDRLDLDLAAADVELLVARTEGWPAGLYLAALSLYGAEDKHALVKDFDGTSAHVVDFVASEVLAAHEPELQTFMLRTSVLERLCAPLCDAVLGGSASDDALESLARSNLFLLPLDDQRRWFRFHHLFAEILRLELERRDPELVATLHRRAFEWHREFGTTDDAIRHAVAAEAIAEAGQLIAENWVHYANAGRTESVLDWLTRFPEALLESDARLLLVEAWVSALRGREVDMRRAVAGVRELGGLDEGPLPDGFVSLESSLSVLSATFGWGDVAAILEHGGRSAELEGPESPWRPVITWALGWAHYCNGDLGRGRAMARGDHRAGARRRPVDRRRGRNRRSLSDRRSNGRRDEQTRLAVRAVELAAERGLIDAVEDGEVHTAHGVALAAQGRYEEALPSLEKGVFLRRLWGQPLDLIDGLIELAAVASATGDRGRAEELFAEAEAIAAACRDAGALPGRVAAARGAARIGPRTRAPTQAELSERELAVLRLLQGRLSQREIAGELFLSFNTVHSHVKAIYRKLGVSSRDEALRRARDERLF